ncbi:hypothetical protein CHARACLAT_000212 [Characodon lateralis]|uniref:Uncharacterized protein n=1 Tax=Characodon lateralis TaxID=208331 RepID=A0ABU7E0G4_9TELE|nr:hypothetical protein [Characodon lateralis]
MNGTAQTHFFRGPVLTDPGLFIKAEDLLHPSAPRCAQLKGAHYSRRGGLWKSRVLSGKANVPLRNLQLKEGGWRQEYFVRLRLCRHISKDLNISKRSNKRTNLRSTSLPWTPLTN